MKQLHALGAILCLLFVACDGDSGDDLFVGGVWRGVLVQTDNECGLNFAQNISGFVHSVNQIDETVILDDNVGVHYEGAIVGDDGFSVDAITATDISLGGQLCDFTQRLEYDGIDDDQDSIDDIGGSGDDDDDPDTAKVDFTITRICNNTTVCEVKYRGDAVRD